MPSCRFSCSLVLVAVLSVMTAGAGLAQEAPAASGGGKALTPSPPSEDPGAAGTQAPLAAPAPGATPAPSQGTTTQQAPRTQKEDPGALGRYFPFIMVGMLVLMFWWMSRSRKKKEAARRDMLSALAKGDKVTSIGGICGTVVEVRDDELVVKVDENNNMRLRFARWAIRGAGDQAKSQGPEDGR